jgi:peptide/nickel transport system substrate-binding protein
MMIRTLTFLLLFALVGCAAAGPSPTAPSPPAAQSAPDQTPTPKTLVVAALNPIKAFGAWTTNLAGGALAYNELHSAGLVTTDVDGKITPRVAQTLPSLADGTMVVLPDGRLQATWTLRPDVRWQDGVPFTAEDVAFSFEVQRRADLALVKSPAVGQIERIDVPDPHTAVVLWKTAYFRPLDLGLRELYLLPKHLLADAAAGDPQAFTNSPYWTTEWVHLSPFHLVDFGLGEDMVFEAFEQFFLGRPKLDRITLKIVSNPAALFAHFQAGAVDIAAENTLTVDHLALLRDAWAQTQGGTILTKQGNWRVLMVQFNPELARPLELSQDARLRRGIYEAIDRDPLREVVNRGFADTDPDGFMETTDPRAAMVGKPFARYHYDPARALTQLIEAGWQRGVGGRVLDRQGQPVQLELRGAAGSAQDVAIVGAGLRQLGIDATEVPTPPALAADKEYTARYAALQATSRSPGDAIFRSSFHSRFTPTAQNGYTGSNIGAYTNPMVDQLIDRLFGTIDLDEQGRAMQQLGEIMADELPALPLYYNIQAAVVVNGVHALREDFAGSTTPGFTSRNAHLWDRE